MRLCSPFHSASERQLPSTPAKTQSRPGFLEPATAALLALPLRERETVTLHTSQDPIKSRVSAPSNFSLIDQLANLLDGFNRKLEFSATGVFFDALNGAASWNGDPYGIKVMNACIRKVGLGED